MNKIVRTSCHAHGDFELFRYSYTGSIVYRWGLVPNLCAQDSSSLQTCVLGIAGVYRLVRQHTLAGVFEVKPHGTANIFRTGSAVVKKNCIQNLVRSKACDVNLVRSSRRSRGQSWLSVGFLTIFFSKTKRHFWWSKETTNQHQLHNREKTIQFCRDAPRHEVTELKKDGTEIFG
jgi:hypothetical protein